jgi:hypothetical protein
MGERSRSQKPNQRIREPNDDYLIGVNLSQQSGDLNEETEDSVMAPKNNESSEPALSYFKSFPTSIRKSKTGSNVGVQKRAGSQRRSQHNDPNQLHYMPKVDSPHKYSPVDTVKNGWVSKVSQEPNARTTEQTTRVYENESSRDISQRATLKMKSKQILFKRNEPNAPSLVGGYKKKYNPDATPVNRYGFMTNRNSGEYRTVRRKRDLILYTTNKSNRSANRLENKFKLKNSSTYGSPSKRKLVQYSLFLRF